MESSLDSEISEISETDKDTNKTETLLDESEIQNEEHRNIEISFSKNKNSAFTISIPEQLEIGDLQQELTQDGSTLSEEKSSVSFNGSLEITVLKATDLQKKDLFQKADPYVVVELDNQKAKTDKKKNSLNPEWNQKMTFKINEFSPKVLSFKVFDWDRFGKDDIMGQTSLEIEDTIINSQGKIIQLQLEDCKSGNLFVSINFDGEIKKISKTIKGVRDLKKHLLDDQSNSTKEEATMKGVRELKDYLLEEDTESNSKTVITRKTTKTTKVKRKVVIDEHGNKREVEKEINESDNKDTETEKDVSKSEWVNIPIIRLDKEPTSPAVQIEELSDEEQTEPLDLTNKLVVEGVVSTPSDEESVVESVEIVEITEEDTDRPHNILSNKSSLSSTSSSVITVVEAEQRHSNKEKDQGKWTVNMPIIRTTPTAKTSDEEEEKKRWSVNIPIIREPEKKLDDQSNEVKTEKEQSVKSGESEAKEAGIVPIAKVDNESENQSARVNSFDQEEPEIVTENMNEKSSSVSHKVTESSLTEMKTENTYSTVTHEVCDLKEKQPQSQTVMNTAENDQGLSNLTHKVSHFNNNLRASNVAHEVHESKDQTNLPVNPILNQGDYLEDLKEGQSREEEKIKTLENENQQLKAFIPNDILDNLPSDLQQSLLQEVYQARDNIVKIDLIETKEERKQFENEDTPSKEDNRHELSPVKDQSTSNIEELMQMVSSLDEETSKYVLEELQNVLTEIDEDIKAQKISSLREDLIKIQIEQNKLMPSLPAEISSNLPPEILQGIEGAMKNAYLEMAKEDLKDGKEREDSKKEEVEQMITEFVENTDEQTGERQKDKRSEVEDMITEFLESDQEEDELQQPVPLPIIPSIPEELLNTIPPEMASMLQASFNSTMAQLSPDPGMINQTSQDLSPKTPSSKKSSLTLNVDDQRDPVRNNDTDNDDVSLPPTPAVQPSWSFIASQPARPQAPTPDSGSNSESTETTPVHEPINTTVDSTVSMDQTPISSEVLILANITADKVITDASAIVAEQHNMQENGNVTVTHTTDDGIVILNKEKNQGEKRKNSTIISTQELHQEQTVEIVADEFVTKTIDDARKLVMKISDDKNVSPPIKNNIKEHESSTTTNQALSEPLSNFKEVQIIKSRSCIEEDRFSRNDTKEKDQTVEIVASDFVTKTIDDARKIVMKISNDENVSTTNEMNIQESQTFESRDLVTEDKHKVSAETNQASSDSLSSFQEVQIIKSRTCIEQDRFSRKDTENQMLKKDTTGEHIILSTENKVTKTNEQMETETDENQPKVDEKVSADDFKIGRKNIKVPYEISKAVIEAISSDNEESDKKPIEGNRTGTDENRLEDEERVETSDNQIEIIEISDANISENLKIDIEVKEERAEEEVLSEKSSIVKKSINSEKEKEEKDEVERLEDFKEAIKFEAKETNEKNEESDIEEVDFQQISDEELLCMENIKSMTENLKRKISDTKKPNNRYRFESRTVKTTEEVRETIGNDMRNTRAAIKQKQTIVIEQTIITIVESVSDWLDRVEYKISTVKRIKTINQRKEELKNIKEEIEVIEETVDELVEVTELAVEVLNDESKVTITSCVQCLTENVKIVKLQRQQSEDELSDSEEKWDEYLEGVKTVGGLIQDLRAEVERIENKDDVLEEKIDTLEGLEILNKGHLNKVTYLFATGNGLSADLPENKIPDEVMTMFQNVRKIENHIQKDKDTAISLLISKSEYEQTLQEYDSIIQAAEFFLTTKVKITEVTKLENEIAKQKKFFINLSHCMQVLSSLEEGFSTEILDHFKDQHEKLNEKSKSVLYQAAHHIASLDQAKDKLSRMETANQEIKSTYLQMEKHLPGSFEFSTEDYISKLENLKMEKFQLLALEKDWEMNENLFTEAGNILNLEDYNVDLSLKYDISDQLDSVNHHIKKLESFSEHWQTYEENYDIIQQWLGSAEEELNKEGSIDLITSEQTAIQQNLDNGHSQFLRAFGDNNVLDDEEQRTYKLQIEARWQQIEKDLENIQKSRQEISFNNIQDICQRTEEIIVQGNGVLNQNSFGNSEDLLLFVKKICFLKLKAKRIKNQIQQINVEADNFEAIEQVGKSKRRILSIIMQLEGKSTDAKTTLHTSCSLQRQISKIILNIEELSKQLKLHPNINFELRFKEIESETQELLKTFENFKLNNIIIESNIVEMSTLQKVLSDLHQSMTQNKQIMQDNQKFNKEIQRKIEEMDNHTNAVNFKLDLTLARGHIDLKRLKSSSENIKVIILILCFQICYF